MPERSYHAMVLVAPRAFEDQHRTLPALGPHEVLVRVHYAGICGTDLALFRGQYETGLPLVLGHEFSGVVHQVGSAVSEQWEGRRVVAEINNTCVVEQREALCRECASHRANHCSERTVIGIDRADGAFAEFVKVSMRNLHPIPDRMSDRVAVLVEPMAAALQTFVLRPLEQGERVVVVGAGRLGCLIIAAARSKGAKVLAVSRSEERRAFALAFGAELALEPTDSLAEQIRAWNNGTLADVAVDVTGHPDGLQTTLDCVRPKGTVCLKTTVGVPTTLDMTRIVVDEIQLSASRCGPYCEAIHFLEQRDLPLDDWFRATFPLGQLALALQEASLPGKVLVDVFGGATA